jgi:hypothetical protein
MMGVGGSCCGDGPFVFGLKIRALGGFRLLLCFYFNTFIANRFIYHTYLSKNLLIYLQICYY